MSDYDPAKNSLRGYSLAIRAIREQKVRRGEVAPGNDTERRWAAEGDRALAEYDTVKEG